MEQRFPKINESVNKRTEKTVNFEIVNKTDQQFLKNKTTAENENENYGFFKKANILYLKKMYFDVFKYYRPPTDL